MKREPMICTAAAIRAGGVVKLPDDLRDDDLVKIDFNDPTAAEGPGVGVTVRATYSWGDQEELRRLWDERERIRTEAQQKARALRVAALYSELDGHMMQYADTKAPAEYDYLRALTYEAGRLLLRAYPADVTVAEAQPGEMEP